jgi:1-deoxy-D-xylulose-5-phosphate reductoisomerase
MPWPQSLDRCLKIDLTASGGPFRTMTAQNGGDDPASRRWPIPTGRWAPRSASISATMMNKGLELIEAHHLFGLPSERIDILVHPSR